MNSGILFLSEIILSLAISLFLIYWLAPLLRGVLTETCGKQNHADFWVRYTQLMLVISPLLIVIFLSTAAQSPTPNLVPLIQDTLFRILIGIFIALSAIGQVIWRSIINQDNEEKKAHKSSPDSSEAI